MKHRVIHKRTATGAIQQWQAEVHPTYKNWFRTISGQVGGKLVESDWTVCEGTNVGRSNERTPEQQCAFEIDALYTKKLERDYHATLNSIDKPKVFLPMLAKEFKELKKPLDFTKGVYCQPKLDGMRCIATTNGLFSRNGKPILSAPHILEQLEPFFDRDPTLILDGELYNHEYKDDFNTIISSARKTKPSKEDLEKSESLIEYHIYDVPSYIAEFSERVSVLDDIQNSDIFATRDLPSLKFVPTFQVESDEHLKLVYEQFLKDGYEGQMVRIDAPYENKRTWSLLKRKESIDEEFELVDLEPGKGNWSGKAKRAILKLPDGRIFKAGVTGTQAFCAKLLVEKEQYIGTLCTVRFFAYTPDGIPRFGRVKEFNRTDNFRIKNKRKIYEDVADIL